MKNEIRKVLGSVSRGVLGRPRVKAAVRGAAQALGVAPKPRKKAKRKASKKGNRK